MIPKLQNLCYEDRLKRKQNAQFHAIKSTNVLLKTSKVAVYTAVLGLFKQQERRHDPTMDTPYQMQRPFPATRKR